MSNKDAPEVRAARRIPIRDCAKCGTPHLTKYGNQACTHHKSEARGGGPCKAAPMAFQTLCRTHGGLAPHNMRAADRRRAESLAMAAMSKFGGPIDVQPSEALLDTVRWTAGYVAWLRGAVETLNLAQLGWGVTQDKTGGEDWGTTEKAGQNVYATMLGEWTDRLVKVCTAALNAGIEERRVRLAEQQGALVADVIKRILGDLNLTPAQQAEIPEIVPRHLRLLTG